MRYTAHPCPPPTPACIHHQTPIDIPIANSQCATLDPRCSPTCVFLSIYPISDPFGTHTFTSVLPVITLVPEEAALLQPNPALPTPFSGERMIGQALLVHSGRVKWSTCRGRQATQSGPYGIPHPNIDQGAVPPWPLTMEQWGAGVPLR